MIIKHKGFTVAGIVGDMSAEITENGGHTEITITGAGVSRSFDLDGLEAFRQDLSKIDNLARQVNGTNGMRREQDG